MLNVKLVLFDIDGRVISVDVFKKNYKVLLNNGEIITVEVDNESKK